MIDSKEFKKRLTDFDLLAKTSNFYKKVYEKHENVNQMYDSIYPYSFHLEMVKNIVLQNMYSFWYDNNKKDYDGYSCDMYIVVLLMSAVEHDLIEDTRMTYNDVLKFNKEMLDNTDYDGYATIITETVYALTDEKGRNRKERHNEEYWSTLKEDRFAPFVKICDRYANMFYSKYLSTNSSSMLDKYIKEINEMERNLSGCIGINFMFNKLKNF